MSTPKEVSIFFSQAATMGYVFKSGKVIHFLGGQYTTSIQSEIDELTEVCAEGGNYYIDETKRTVDAATLDPIAAIYAKALAQAKAELAAATDPNRDMGETQFTGKLEGIANSNTIRGLGADSTSVAGDAPKVAAGTIKVAATATATKL